MAGANKKTTMAKLNRERKLRERRMEKQARKEARKQGLVVHRGDSGDVLSGVADQGVRSVAEVGSGAHESTLPAGGSATGDEPDAAPNEPGA
jgi:hypothetical protein